MFRGNRHQWKHTTNILQKRYTKTIKDIFQIVQLEIYQPKKQTSDIVTFLIKS